MTTGESTVGPDAVDPFDAELVQAASRIVRERYRPDWHFVGAALRTATGRVLTAVNLGAYVSRIAVCAEAVAVGMAIASGEMRFERIVAVFHPPPDAPARREIRVVSPCGMCRELLCDYSPEVMVLMPHLDGFLKVPVTELLPDKYSRE